MSHIEIHGIPEELYTSTNEVVTKLAQKLNVPILTDDIDILHKLYNGKDKPKGPFTDAIFGAIFVALSNATFVASVN